jgi:hypothetical protein
MARTIAPVAVIGTVAERRDGARLVEPPNHLFGGSVEAIGTIIVAD